MDFKIVPWDSKIFKKDVYEIIGDFSEDGLKEFERENSNLFMIFTKIDVSDVRKIHSFEKNGFNFIETQILLYQ